MQDLLKTGLERLGIEPNPSLVDNYLKYIELLAKWNKAYNLTAVKEPEAMLKRHVLDSLSVLTFIQGPRCLDVGTGPGLPGMILAMAQPDIHWSLLDSNQKKIRFLRHLKVELDIGNVDIIQSRIEDFKPEAIFDTVICRAFAPLNRMLKQTQHLIYPGNQLLAMKGKQAKAEIEQLDGGDFLIKLNNLQLSDEESPSNLIQIKRAE
jgi:16S rRNA (guanine527-N7)-methyltransferase